MNLAKQLRQLMRFLGLLSRPKAKPTTVEPAPVPEPVPEPQPEPEPAAKPWPTRDQVLRYRGHLCNLRDADGHVIWTPSLPALPRERRDAWLAEIRAHGGTHVPIGPFTPGPIYTGSPWSNPDWEHDAAAIRALVIEILDQGMVPVVFLDGGGRDPRTRIDRTYRVIRQALDGLHDHVLPVLAWEPVVGDWRSSDVAYALKLWHSIAPEFFLGYHGSPERLVGSSNPVEPDDPWQGGESSFYKEHGGEHIDIALYQTRHGAGLYRDCSPDDGESCWLDRWRDYVLRIGGGLNGWRVLPLVLLETCAYEFFRGQATHDDARMIATRAKRIADAAGVEVFYGNGLPY